MTMKAITLTWTLACAGLFSTAAAHAGLKERLAERRADREAQAWQAPGLQEHRLQVGGLARSWLLYLPRQLDPKRPAPVVFAFHGGGGWAAYMTDDDRYGWLAKADQAGFVAVFPSGYSKFPGGRLATWNAGGCCGDARDREVDDVAFVRAIWAELRDKLQVDPARVYATGMSNGGMMSHRLACDMADVFAAVAAVAGTDATDTCRPARPVSVLHIHAKDDTHVLYEGGAGPGAFRDASKVMDFVSVPATVQAWVSRNRCPAPAQTVLAVPGARCEAHTACSQGVAVEVCTTEEGGHSWPGAAASRQGKAPPSQAIRANDVIWDFFVQHHR
ncbi:MAG: hypothetical protein RI907_547 [Pseudomonadota bacterium]|jgi:polyhydroxybutyrate depolymerase